VADLPAAGNPAPGGLIGVLLAAGAGTRFGGDKLIQSLKDGTPVGVAALRNLRAVVDRVVAVVRPGHRQLADLLRAEGAEVVVCHDAGKGMGHSLACAISNSGECAGWVVALGDMPSVRTGTISQVAEALRSSGEVVMPCFRGERGHPVGFPGHLRAALCALTGDQGARALLSGRRAGLRRIDVDDPGVLRDIDTPADLAAIEGG